MVNQTFGNLTLDIATINNLESLIRGYIINCRCEGKSPKTVTNYIDKLRCFVWYCKQKGYPDDPKALTPGHIGEFLCYLSTKNRWGKNHPAARNPASTTTVQDYYRVLRTFFGWLEREMIITDNPLSHIKTPKVDKKVVEALTPREVDRLLNGCTAKTTKEVRNIGL